jgi:hypothetical protein
MGIDDDVVIYTGYTKEELTEKQYLELLKEFGNLVIKYGRYLPNNKRHYDDAEDLEEYDGPLFLTRPLDPALLATSSLLPPGGAPDPKYQETSSRSGFIKRRRL